MVPNVIALCGCVVPGQLGILESIVSCGCIVVGQLGILECLGRLEGLTGGFSGVVAKGG